MATYTWIGSSGTAFAFDVMTDWSPSGTPTTGDTAIVNTGGTILLGDGRLQGNTFWLDGGISSAAAAARLTFSGDQFVTFNLTATTSPSVDPASMIETATAPGESSASGASIIDALGNFINQGSILANDPAGGSLTINVGTTTINGTLFPGYAYNYGVLEATAGNTLTINIGTDAEIFSTGSLIADGGTVRIIGGAGAIDGGWTTARNYAFVAAGGTLEISATYASSVGGNTPSYFFLDSVAGDTLKIDNIAAFSGQINEFSVGDSIDLGASFTVGTLIFSATSDILNLENTSGSVVASLLLRSGAFGSGTFAVTAGTADGFVLGTGADGDTILTTNLVIPVADGVSGAWQSPGVWANSTLPGLTDTPAIGLGSTANFTLTTGGSPLTVAGFGVADPNATLQITSDVTATSRSSGATFGTLDVMPGNTLLASSLSQSEASSAMTIAAGATAALSGHVSTGLENVGGDLTTTAGNPFALTVNNGTAEIDGSLLAGPTVAGGGGNASIGQNSNGAAVVTVNGNGVAGDGVVTDTYSLLGSDPTSSGTLTLNGAGASWTDVYDNTNTLHTTGFILVGYNSETNTPAGLTAPGPFGTAQVLIENGATLADQEAAYVADSPQSSGDVTVTGPGSLWNLATGGTGYANIGYAGSGILSVLNGGSVAIGNVGTFWTNGTTFTGGGIGVGQSAGASGTVIVSGTSAGVSSQLTTADGMAIGKLGQGLLDITNGGTVNVNAGGIGVGVSNATTSSGTIDVGGGSLASVLNFASISNGLGIANGTSAVGTVTVSDNGLIMLQGSGSSGQGVLGIGNGVASNAQVIVGGTTAAAVIDVGNGITVGSHGNGSLTINQLGSVILTGATGGITIGQSGEVGALTVNAGVLTEESSGDYGVTVGWNGGKGSVLDENDGSMSVTGITLGQGSATSTGSVTITSGAVLNDSVDAVNVGGVGTGTMTVSNLGSLVMTGTASINIDSTNGTTSQMTVAGGAVDFTDPTNFGMTVGNSGSGVLIVSDGSGHVGSISAEGYIGVGNSAGSHGTLIVGGTSVSAVFNETGTQGITVGNDGTGALFVNNLGTIAITGTSGITIGYTTGASGTMTVNGGYVTEAATSYGINMSNSAGAASLLVENAGTIALAGGGINVAAFSRGTNDTVTVTGAGALIQSVGAGGIRVGGSGNAVMSVNAGASIDMTGTSGITVDSTDGTASQLSVAAASVTAPWFNVGVSGTAAVTVADGGIVNLDTYTNLGLNAGSSGSMIIGGTSAAAVVNLSGGNLNDGLDGSGNLTINSLGTLAMTGTAGIFVGWSASATGMLTVDGGKVTAASSFITVGGTLNAAGSMLVENHGSVASGNVALAQGTGTSGTLTVTGGSSQLSDTGGLQIGGSGLGDMAIEQGGTVTAANGAVIAVAASASGSSVNVADAGSNWQITGGLTVGAAGFGELSVAQGASVIATSLDAASASGGTGQISIVGSGSDLTVTGTADIGDQSVATMSILNGGSFQAGYLNVGMGSATGAITVAGPNTDFHITNDMTVGHNGVYSIGNNVTVFINGNFDEIGAVNQGDGSLIDPSTVTNSSPHGGGGGSQLVASGSITNSSTYFVGDNNNGSYILTTPLITGTGVLEADPATNAGALPDLVLNTASIASTQTIVFGGQPAEITLGSDNGTFAITGFSAKINSFQAGDTIVVDSANGVTFQQNGSVISVINDVGGATLGTLAFASASLATIAATTAGALASPVPCFAAGTRIATSRGPVAVEDLAIGDGVRTADGAIEAIVWIGHRTVDCARHREPETVWPIRVARGAFGDNVPARDLYLSPNHAVFVDGVLVPVKLLVNGTTIAQAPRSRVSYFHVELPRHAVILAEGLTVESYLDTGDRADFHGGAALRLFPDFAARPAPDTARLWETRSAAPLVTTGPRLLAARGKVAPNRGGDRSVARAAG